VTLRVSPLCRQRRRIPHISRLLSSRRFSCWLRSPTARVEVTQRRVEVVIPSAHSLAVKVVLHFALILVLRFNLQKINRWLSMWKLSSIWRWSYLRWFSWRW
jgi:hypothetical protein